MYESFPWIDLLFLIIIFFTFITGFVKGLLRETVTITFLVIGLIFAFSKFKHLSILLRPFLKIEGVCDFISFFLILILFLCIGAFLSFIFRKFILKGPIKFLDRILGAFFGAIKGTLIVFIIIILLIAFFPKTRLTERSFIAYYTIQITSSIAKILPVEIYERFEKNIEMIERGGENGKRV